MATKRDYYEVLGVKREAEVDEIKKAYRQHGPEEPPRQEPGRRRGRAAVQGGGRGVRGPLRPGEAAAVRPLRPRRARRGGRPRLPQRRRHHVGLLRHLRRRPVRRPLRPAPPRPAARPGPADEARDRAPRGRPRHDQVDRGRPARSSAPSAGARARRRGRSPPPATTAAARARSSSRAGSSRSPRPARPAAARGRGSPTPARPAGARAASTQTAHIKVDVPPGVETGMWLQLRNQGEPGDLGRPAGQPPDPDPGQAAPVLRAGPATTCICQVPISFPQAALGAEIEVPTLDGPDRPERPPRDAERRGPQAQGPRDARHQRPGPRATSWSRSSSRRPGT